MNLVNAIVLGLVQGLTEFLPVSSSGHLVLVQKFFPAFSQPGVLFDVVLHGGTLLAVLVYFRKAILKLDTKYVLLLIVGSIPAAVVGYLFSDFIEGLFTSVKVVGVALLATAVMNFLTDRARQKEGKRLKILDSFVIGLSQAVAIIPGVSRSGSTIFTAAARGVEKRQAAQFSFLLSVPAVFGANLLQFLKYSGNGFDKEIYLVGFIGAFISGYFAIYLVFKFLTSRNFKVFGFYCLVIATLALLF